ncbi:type II toxin-antitoxin system Phd/YefM family antitoxin [Limnohabitans sp.]|uniref:type II toxin-antitoxin system Phd/YefM family antitoxin n=1 Tax=Limnohabitans sp. TaxID=1907725 RepID=UPI0035B2E9E2
MTHQILSETAASISELKRNPMGTVAAGDGFPVAILNRNEPAFYCVPAAWFETMMAQLEDIELNQIANARQGQKIIPVSLDEL